MGCQQLVGPFLIGVALLLGSGSPALADEAEQSHRARLVSARTNRELLERQAAAHLQANPRDGKAFRDRGLARLEAGRLHQAVADLRQAEALEPSSAEVRAELAFAFILAGRFPEALEAARSSLTLDPNQAAAHAYAGHVLLRTGGPLPEVFAHLERASQRLPKNVDVRLDLLEACRQKGDFPRAFAQLRMLRYLLEPTDPRVIYQEGVLQVDLGNHEAAISRFRAVLAADPAHLGARQDLGAILIESERPLEALTVLQPLAREQPRSFAAAYFHASALAKLQRHPEAETEVRRALALDADSADGHMLLGRILAARGQRAPAILVLRNALLLDAGNLEFRLYLGELLAAGGELNEALAVLQEAVRLAPQSAVAHRQLASTLRLAGQEDEAARVSAAASRLQPQQPGARSGDEPASPPSRKP